MRRWRAHRDGMQNRRSDLDQSGVVFYDDFYTPSLAGKWRGSGVGVYSTGGGYVFSNATQGTTLLVPLVPFDFTKIIHVSFTYQYQSTGGGRDLTMLPRPVFSDSLSVANLQVNCCNTSYPQYNIFGPGANNTAWSPVPSAYTWTRIDVFFSPAVQRLYANQTLKVTRTEYIPYSHMNLTFDIHGGFYMKDLKVRYAEAPFLNDNI